jgi:hypothetical protein
MTTKDIARAIGKEERTVRNWVKRLAEKSSVVAEKLSVSSPMKPADYDLEETVSIIEIGLGKNAASLFRENAQRSAPRTPADEIAAIVRETVSSMVPMLIAAVQGAIPPRAVAQIQAPEEISERDQLRRVINRYALKLGEGGHRQAWSDLYTDFYYRYHRNLRECAKNRGMDTLDYAEAEGLMGQLLAAAIQITEAA